MLKTLLKKLYFYFVQTIGFPLYFLVILWDCTKNNASLLLTTPITSYGFRWGLREFFSDMGYGISSWFNPADSWWYNPQILIDDEQTNEE